ISPCRWSSANATTVRKETVATGTRGPVYADPRKTYQTKVKQYMAPMPRKTAAREPCTVPRMYASASGHINARQASAPNFPHLAAFLLTAPLAWRVTTFRVLAALGGCVFLVPLQQAISPWGAVTLSNTDGVTDVNLHRWSAALAGGPDAGLAALLFYLAWRPMRAQLVLQWAALAAIVFLAANVPFAGPAVAVHVLPGVPVV